MLLPVLLTGLALAKSVHGHSFVMSVWQNGKDTWDAKTVGTTSSYLRAPLTNSPVQSLTDAALACNVNGKKEVSGWLKASPGDTLEPEWYHAGERGADPIDPSHKGPIYTYIAPYDSNGEGDVWVKISEEAWSTETSNWAVDRMIANKGRNTVTLPSTLAAGKYLVRFDLMAMHSASGAPPNGAQFYPSCAQLEVTGSGTQVLPAGIAIPGTFTADTPGIVWSIYYSADHDIHTDYVIPGPAVWDGSANYPTGQCKTPLDGLAAPGFCYDGDSSGNTTTPAKTAVAPASSAAVSAAVSAVASSGPSSAVVGGGVSSAAGSPAASAVAPSAAVSDIVPSANSTVADSVSAKAAPTSVAAVVSSAVGVASSVPGSATTTAVSSKVTDYSGCMMEYNACLDAANAAQASAGGGAVDFSKCTNDCSSAYGRRMRRVARGERRLGGSKH